MQKNINKHCCKWLVINCLALFFLWGCKNEKPWRPGMPLPKEKIKIAIIHPNEINRDSFFDNAHYMGTLEMQRNIGLEDSQIIRKTNVYDGDLALSEGVIRDCIAEGANIIIAASWGYMDPCEKLAAEFPQVIFFHTTGYKLNSHNFTNYSIRLYQARYLSGIVAGMKTQTGKIGYVAAMGSDNSEVTGGINAFAIGVHETNPDARIYVKVTHSWFDPMGETDAANDLIIFGCDIIAAHSNTAMAQIAAQKAGVWSIGFNGDMLEDAPDAVITSVVPHWGALYTRFLENVINGHFNTTPYIYGLAEGAVDITAINEKLSVPGMEAVVQEGRQRIISGRFNVFDGVLKENNGKNIGEEGKTLSDEVIFGDIGWYYQNVTVMK